ncbi:GreA/GreB family elongation factor [Nocardiopsis sp. HNM0947]|uniref:GreA/GreB family elongation factor n=1 Tax=Nocardiopsis coralli TaxID=2772213 RepID=A0ABR9PF22_9ACTN|nr:GreA/GreB family elongation factor [Nocardiopsis coralli]MBE3002441.1 GreA/GreB family elongation factor [Nocardiopsis coralli]
MQRTTTWLTAATHDRLVRELAVLTGAPVPPETAAEFEVPVDQERRDTRIARIQELLRDAVVGEAPPDDGVAEPGMVLTVRYGSEEEAETFLLGVRDRSDAEGITVYSPESPLGRALIGAREGEEREYTTPRGKTFAVTLVRAVPYRPA